MEDIFASPPTRECRPAPVKPSAVMDGYLAYDDAAAGAVNLGSRRPMVNREYAQSASGSPVKPQRPNFDPWLKQHADASEASHNDSSNHRKHCNLRRLQRLDILHSDPIRPSSPSLQHSQLFSPRWDSRSAGASPISSPRFPIPVSTTPQRTRAESSPTPRPPPRSAFPGLCSNPFIPAEIASPTPRSPVRQFPLLATHDEVQLPSVTSPTTATHAEHLYEMRQPTPTEGHPPIVENFSRPRKPSVRSQNSEPPPSRHYHSTRLQPESALDQQSSTHVYPNHNRAPSPWSRSRGLSTSSSQSTSTFSSLPHRPSNDQLRASSRSSVRRRDRTPTGTSNTRPPLAHTNNTLTPNREHQPWLSTGDELRSSYRSQLTTSTAQATLFTTPGTERSSVLTKTSSVTEQSIINGYAHTSWRQTIAYEDDGLSLEDVMGMYERGFNDSDIESIRKSMRFVDDDEDTQEIGRASGAMTFELSRPPSSRSDASAMRAKMLEAMNDQLPAPGALAIPETSPASKRQSRNSIRKSLLPSSLPKDMGLGFGEYMKRNRGVAQDQTKHDSAKLVGADEEVQRSDTGSPSSPITLAKPLSPANAPAEAAASRPITPILAAQIPQEPLEEPGCRDRYGFKKANANVTRDEYDAWDATYQEYLARRRRKWIAYLKDNSLMTDRPNRFPARNAKTKRFIRKGIPPDWRGAAWFYYAGGPAILGKHRGVYDDLVRRAALDPVGPGKIPNRASEVKTLVIEDIEKDLHRTFPDNVRFKPPRSATPPPQTPDNRQASDEPMDEEAAKRASEPVIITSLRRVLHAFALYNPRIGYCQSLNFLAGLLLLFVDTEEQAFWLLNVITRVYLPGTHEMSLEGSKVDLGVLMLTLKDSLPNVWKHIGGDEHEGPTKRFRGRRGVKDNTNSGPGANDPNRLPTITICMTAWFMSCFIGTLPIETVLRVWDVFFYEGSRTLFRIALTIFKLGESEIKAVADPMEMFGVVQSFPRKLIDCNAVMEACYRRRNGIGHLSQEVVEEKREERRAGIRRWRAEQEAAANAMTNPMPAAAGLDLAADIDVNRKGTLFGKRRDKDREQVRADEVM